MAGQLENLDTAEPLAKRVARHDFDRLIMLADGVFAIGVTLSALELRAPADWDGTMGGFFDRMGLPLGVYAVSFAVVALFWIGQRRTMARLARVDGLFTALMLLFLALIAVVPAGNRFLIEAAGPRNGPALGVYLGLITALSGVHGAMWAYAAFVRGLVLPEVGMRFRVAHLVAVMVTPPLGFALSMGVVRAGDPVVRLALCAALVVMVSGRRVMTRWAERPERVAR